MDQLFGFPPVGSHARILNGQDTGRCLDSLKLQRLEESFRDWVESSRSPALQGSRRRILLIFLLIRYTGARLSEVLNLHPGLDIDCDLHMVKLRKTGTAGNAFNREVQIPERLSAELREALQSLQLKSHGGKCFKVDPGHVRRKFYARAEAAGLPRDSGTPEAVRRSRAVELMQSNVPLPVVQKILGHSTPSLAASYVEFSDEEIREVARRFADRENERKTSARNSFFGKIERVRGGDVQTALELVSLGGVRVFAVITNHSHARLGLKPGTLATAEVKAPWVMLFRGGEEPHCTAENRFSGQVCRIMKGRVTTEVVVRIQDGTELCSIITAKSNRRLNIREGDPMWAAFSAFAVVLHTD